MTENNWNPDLYDQKHDFVAQYGAGILQILNPQAGEKILDVGCGTGDLTWQISQAGAEVKGIDSSGEMIVKAKAKYTQLCFECVDITRLEQKEAYDAVFSNAVFHWIKDQKLALERVFACLRGGGRFVAEFGGKRNLELILRAVYSELKQLGYDCSENSNPWYFPGIGEYTSLMEKAGFEVEFAQWVNRPTRLKEGCKGLRNWLEMFGEPIFSGVSAEDKENAIQAAETRLKSLLFKDGNWYADYRRIRVVGRKPAA